jgi:hypothetical protein
MNILEFCIKILGGSVRSVRRWSVRTRAANAGTERLRADGLAERCSTRPWSAVDEESRAGVTKAHGRER